MSDDQTGYGKPPKNKRFVPGRSGNPRGRPRKEDRHLLPRQLRKDVLHLLEERFPVKTPKGTRMMSGMQVVLRSSLQRAIAGNPTAIKLWMSLARSALDERLAAHGPVRLLDRLLDDRDRKMLRLQDFLDEDYDLGEMTKHLY